MDSEVLVTLDIDWAPDWMIDDVAARLQRAGVRSTWFATHQSSATEQLLSDPLFEVGLHPNFLPGSTHGSTADEVLQTLQGWFPSARAIRTHSLYQSEPLLQKMANEYRLEIDCSIHLPQATHVKPHRLKFTDDGRELIRIPHVFQDNMYMMQRTGWPLSPEWLTTPGLKVLNFHPVHIVLNATDLQSYSALKRRNRLVDVGPGDVGQVDCKAPGIGSFFNNVLEVIASRRTQTISEYADSWLAASGKDLL